MAARQRRSPCPSGLVPSDEELVAFVTEPMTSVAVARHFGLPGPVCLKRMRQLADQGHLERPWYGVYAPSGASSGPKPLTGRRAQVLALLDRPRTRAEVRALTGTGHGAGYALERLIREGHAVHCGRGVYLRADLEGQFEPQARQAWPRPLPPKGVALRVQIVELLAEPRGSDEIARLLRVDKHRVAYMLGRLIREGGVTRAVRAGYRERYIYSRAEAE